MQTLDFPLSHFITARRVRLLARLWLRRGSPPCPPGCCWGHAEPHSVLTQISGEFLGSISHQTHRFSDLPT